MRFLPKPGKTEKHNPFAGYYHNPKVKGSFHDPSFIGTASTFNVGDSENMQGKYGKISIFLLVVALLLMGFTWLMPSMDMGSECHVRQAPAYSCKRKTYFPPKPMQECNVYGEVHTQYVGKIGSKLFQYCFARAIHFELPGFALMSNGAGSVAPLLANQTANIQAWAQPLVKAKGKLPEGETVASAFSKMGFKRMLSNCQSRRIVMDAAHVQTYAYFKPYKSLIRNQWVKIPQFTHNQPAAIKTVGPPQPGDVVVHYRVGITKCAGGGGGGDDAVECSEESSRMGVDDQGPAPPSYYKTVLKGTSFKRVLLLVQSPKQDLKTVRELKALFPDKVVVVPNDDIMVDFWFMANAWKIVMSPGTISWWAAFMSNALEVHYPVTDGGPRDRNRLNHRLHVDDEPRYVYHDLRQNEMFLTHQDLMELHHQAADQEKESEADTKLSQKEKKETEKKETEKKPPPSRSRRKNSPPPSSAKKQPAKTSESLNKAPKKEAPREQKESTSKEQKQPDAAQFLEVRPDVETGEQQTNHTEEQETEPKAEDRTEQQNEEAPESGGMHSNTTADTSDPNQGEPTIISEDLDVDSPNSVH